jgi:transposase
MWTPTTRQKHSRTVTRYQTDLTDTEWRVIAPHLPKPCATGRPREWPMREIVNGIFYVTRAGCPWRLVPSDLPPWGTIYRPWVGMASVVAVLIVLALGHRWSVTGSWFTSDKTCGERHGTRWFVQRLDMDCDRLLRARLWKLYDEGYLFGRLRGGRGGAVEYIMKQLEHPDE